MEDDTAAEASPRFVASSPTLPPGERVAGYVVEEAVGAGGMGVVYRARSNRDSGLVALKILSHVHKDARRRLLREGHVLRRLDDPAIVRHLAHGSLHDGAPYLVMEWIEGTTLGMRLRTSALSLDQTLSLGLQLAGALATVHRSGIIHRDVKPSNVMLAGGDPAAPKLVDFGIARLPVVSVRTAPGALIGTPTYMSPEQARGAPVDASCDVFSLGCVLYECLTGKPVFAPGPIALVLSRILDHEAPSLSAQWREAPPAVERLLSAMLAKDPRARPCDGVELTLEMQRVVRELGRTAAEIERGASSLSTLIAAHPVPRSLLHAVRGKIAPYDADVERLVDGTVIAVMRGGFEGTLLSASDGADERAARAARCAQALTGYLGDARLALVTGRSSLPRTGSVTGEAVDRACALLHPDHHDVRSGHVVLDQATADLVDRRFHVDRTGPRPQLLSERAPDEAARTVLGRATPFVGREVELSLLAATFDECRLENTAAAAIVSGAAGCGKSRLAAALVERVRRDAPAAEVLLAATDSTRADSAFALLGDVLKRAAGRDYATGARLRPLLDRLAEIATSETGSAVARGVDLIALGDSLRASFIDFLDAECAQHPVLLVLEDIHWADATSIDIVEAALHALADRPLMVLSCSSAEGLERFPQLFGKRCKQEIRLGALTRRAASTLVRALLGDGIGDDVVSRLVDAAGGNAFYLEEMVRAYGEGGLGTMPRGMRAMIEARLGALAPDARAVLRAASVYGERFGAADLSAILEHSVSMPAVSMPAVSVSAVARAIEALIDTEILVHRPHAHASVRGDLAFRHDLLREASHSLSSDDERSALHARAGAWLQQAGETDAMALASHFDLGLQRARAAHFYLRAGQQALAGNDFGGAIDRATRAASCADVGDDAMVWEARLVIVDAHRARSEWDRVRVVATSVYHAAPPASPAWFGAAGELAYACAVLGQFDVGETTALEILRHWDATAVTWPAFVALANAAVTLFYAGRVPEAHQARDELRRSPVSAKDDRAIARVEFVNAMACVVEGDLEGQLDANERAARAFERAGDERAAGGEWIGANDVCQQLGLWERAETIVRGVLATAERVGLPGRILLAEACLGELALRRGAVEEARLCYEACLEVRGHENRRLVGWLRAKLAAIHLQQGHLDDAEREADTAHATGEGLVHLLAHAEATRARIKLVRGDGAAAVELARNALLRVRTASHLDAEGAEAYVELAAAEVSWAQGHHDEARAIVAAARERLEQRASRLRDPAMRAAFLEQVVEHAALIDRAREWCDVG